MSWWLLIVAADAAPQPEPVDEEPPVDAASIQPGLGRLERSVIDEEIKRNLAQVKYCYQRTLEALSKRKRARFGGEVVVMFTIERDGTVQHAEIASSELGHDEVEACILGRFLGMAFPQPEGDGVVKVTYPFIFSPNETRSPTGEVGPPGPRTPPRAGARGSPARRPTA